MFAELQADSFDHTVLQQFPPISNIIINIVILKGTLQIVIDNIRHKCTPSNNNIVNIKPVNTITQMTPGNDFKGHIIILPKSFMDRADHGVKPIPFRDVLSMRFQLTITPQGGIEILADYFRLIVKTRKPMKAVKPVSSNMILLCHLKITQMIFAEMEKQQKKRLISRSSLLCNQFTQLLTQHIEEEHEVLFYADKLNITPHYLTKITHKYIGFAANKVIANELITQASLLLRNPDYTLQQIADRLHFCDQSSFGKFFKKHTGKTPATYRADTNIPIE
ncbi:MAG: helix-turn-helix domain-containing protein [Butyricimonas paravirosa]